MDKLYYAGVGSRAVPEKIAKEMTKLARQLESMGYTLRSGNADGSDQAFAKGVDTNAQIWLPNEKFNIGFRRLHPKHTYIISPNDKESLESVNKFHPHGPKLNEQSREFMARNYRQVVGLNEPDSQFVVCWTPDGKEVGGTAQAIRIAKFKDIPVYNMFDFTIDQILSQINKLNILY